MFFFFSPLSFFFYLQNTKLNLNVAKYDANDADDEDQMDEDDDDEVRQPLFTLATATNLADTLSTKDKSIIAPFKILSCTVENNGFKETQTFNNVFATAERDVLDIVLPKSESNQELLFAADGNTVCIRYELIKNWDLLTKNQPNNQPTLTFTFKTNHDLYDDKSPIENEEFDHNGILKLVIDAESNNDIRALRDLLVDRMVNSFTSSEGTGGGGKGIHSQRVGRQMLETSFLSITFDEDEVDSKDSDASQSINISISIDDAPKNAKTMTLSKLRQKVKKKIKWAIHELGRRYEIGQGVELSLDKAFNCYRKVAMLVGW